MFIKQFFNTISLKQLFKVAIHFLEFSHIISKSTLLMISNSPIPMIVLNPHRDSGRNYSGKKALVGLGELSVDISGTCESK